MACGLLACSSELSHYNFVKTHVLGKCLKYKGRSRLNGVIIRLIQQKHVAVKVKVTLILLVSNKIGLYIDGYCNLYACHNRNSVLRWDFYPTETQALVHRLESRN